MSIPVPEELAPLLCPRCHLELAPHDIFPGGCHATVGICVECGGQWMQSTDLERLSEVVEPVMMEWRRLGSPRYQATELTCPECGDPVRMKKSRSTRDAQVVLDQCDRCGGVWLDGKELTAIQQESLLALLSSFVQSRSAPAGL